jgi:hypothetical protein
MVLRMSSVPSVPSVSSASSVPSKVMGLTMIKLGISGADDTDRADANLPPNAGVPADHLRVSLVSDDGSPVSQDSPSQDA